MSDPNENLGKPTSLLSETRFLAFLDSDFPGSIPNAIELAKAALQSGVHLQDLFSRDDGLEFSATAVSSHSPDTFTIDFGCTAGPEAGDGGSWEVVFRGDQVISITERLRWIS